MKRSEMRGYTDVDNVGKVKDYQLLFNFYFVYWPCDSFETPKLLINFIQQVIVACLAISFVFFLSFHQFFILSNRLFSSTASQRQRNNLILRLREYISSSHDLDNFKNIEQASIH